MKFKDRQQMLLVIAIGGLAILGLQRLVFNRLSALWSERSKRITELKKLVGDGTVTLDREHVIRTRWDSMRTNTLPSNRSAAESQVFTAFDRWSQESKISISSIKPQWQPNEDYTTLECRADGSGNLQALTRFLYNLEKGPPALRLESVEITARDNQGQQLTLGLQVSGLLLEAPPEP